MMISSVKNNQKMQKCFEGANRRNDIISRLPDDVLCQILSPSYALDGTIFGLQSTILALMIKKYAGAMKFPGLAS